METGGMSDLVHWKWSWQETQVTIATWWKLCSKKQKKERKRDLEVLSLPLHWAFFFFKYCEQLCRLINVHEYLRLPQVHESHKSLCQYWMLIDIIYVLFVITLMEKLLTITSSIPSLKPSEVNQRRVRLISAQLHSLAIPAWKDMKQNYMSIYTGTGFVLWIVIGSLWWAGLLRAMTLISLFTSVKIQIGVVLQTTEGIYEQKRPHLHMHIQHTGTCFTFSSHCSDLFSSCVHVFHHGKMWYCRHPLKQELLHEAVLRTLAGVNLSVLWHILSAWLHLNRVRHSRKALQVCSWDQKRPTLKISVSAPPFPQCPSWASFLWMNSVVLQLFWSQCKMIFCFLMLLFFGTKVQLSNAKVAIKQWKCFSNFQTNQPNWKIFYAMKYKNNF